MAEKEERILCIETYEKIAECGYGDFYNTITRQEAIERIAKKICAYSWETLNELAQAKYMERAEAALNALLDGGNDENKEREIRGTKARKK